MMACPKCGRETRVRETRGNARTRACTSPSCDGRLHTLELVVPSSEVAVVERVVAAIAMTARPS